MRTTSRIAIGVGVLALLACQGTGERVGARDTITPGADPAPTSAGSAGLSVPMRDAGGRELGTVTLAEAGEGIAVSGTLRGLPPGAHAIHLHMTGRCDPPTFESAGGHWNPTSRQHGSQNPQGPHLGDMPNVTVGADSAVTVQATTPGGTLRGQNAVLDGDGAAVVIHRAADDYRTDPSGGSGDRIACGIVQGS